MKPGEPLKLTMPGPMGVMVPGPMVVATLEPIRGGVNIPILDPMFDMFDIEPRGGPRILCAQASAGSAKPAITAAAATQSVQRDMMAPSRLAEVRSLLERCSPNPITLTRDK